MIPSRLKTLKEIEADTIREYLIYYRYNKSATAFALGIARNTLYLKMNLYGIKGKVYVTGDMPEQA